MNRISWIAGCLLLLGTSLQADETALDRYVAKPDPSYSWKLAHQAEEDGTSQYVIDLTSQTWRTEKDVNRPLWKHALVIVKPAGVTSKTAFLFIVGGGNGGELPSGADGKAIAIAKATQSVVAELRMVPNQPLIFHQDKVPRNEDDIIGYTWDQFLKTGDDTWPARLPMVKSAVRAMDCVQEFLGSEQGGKHTIDGFVVAGGSKRGWTTWCTAAVDKRVVAAIPIVIDVLNVRRSMAHHTEAYGFYAMAVGDYMKHNIMQRIGHPRLDDLYAIEDPYSYRNRFTMPKFVLNASGDQFFCPDSSQFYYGDLPGEKYLRYVPNADHSLKDTDAVESIIAFYSTVLRGAERPRYSWKFEEDGSIRVESPTPPKEVVVWQAHNPKARDFRADTIGKTYTSSPVSAVEPGLYVAKVDKPAEGWKAFFVELTYDVGAPVPLKLTSAVRILPDTLPFEGIDPAKAPYEPFKAIKPKAN
ncbi:PhoPQ-activated pathogenicity-related family protein [bacterium]|nr:PhoPQ-activated pathogenicity-related family protein [bacterium]